MTTVLVSEDPSGKRHWRHYFIVRDGGLTLMEMDPALYGWNVRKVTEQGADHWEGMSEATIVAWRVESGAVLAHQEVAEWCLAYLSRSVAAVGVRPF